MAAKFTLNHEINCDAATFWKTFLDKDWTQKFFLESMNFPEFEVLEQTETDKEIRRRARAMPKVDMPALVQKIMGSGFRYTEEATFDKASQVYRWKMIPSSMA